MPTFRNSLFFSFPYLGKIGMLRLVIGRFAADFMAKAPVSQVKGRKDRLKPHLELQRG
jgi:hypothetical protein